MNDVTITTTYNRMKVTTDVVITLNEGRVSGAKLIKFDPYSVTIEIPVGTLVVNSHEVTND